VIVSLIYNGLEKKFLFGSFVLLLLTKVTKNPQDILKGTFLGSGLSLVGNTLH
jgi:hypothetical protein